MSNAGDGTRQRGRSEGCRQTFERRGRGGDAAQTQRTPRARMWTPVDVQESLASNCCWNRGSTSAINSTGSARPKATRRRAVCPRAPRTGGKNQQEPGNLREEPEHPRFSRLIEPKENQQGKPGHPRFTPLGRCLAGLTKPTEPAAPESDSTKRSTAEVQDETAEPPKSDDPSS